MKRCPACGKLDHEGKCSFDKTKKSVIEEQSDDIKKTKTV